MSIHMETAYPEEVEKAKREKWHVIIPVGVMEYHSHHCPYGCDGLVASGIAEELAKRTECMIMPTVWYGVASYAVAGPEKNTLNIDCDVFEKYMYNILKSLFKSGFTENICILIFHQTEDYLPTALSCMKAAKTLIFEYMEEKEGMGWWGKNYRFYENIPPRDNPWNKIRVFNGAAFPEKYEEDHAGKFECSMLESLYPGYVKLERLDKTEDLFAESAAEMSAEEGRKMVEKSVNNILRAIKGD